MKKLLILLFSIMSSQVLANLEVYSCEAGQVSGEGKTLKHNLYNNIFPTIIINSQNKEVSYSYLAHERRWDKDLRIIEEDESNIIAINIVDAGWIDVIHFNKKEITFSLVYAGDKGNSLNYGQCFE